MTKARIESSYAYWRYVGSKYFGHRDRSLVGIGRSSRAGIPQHTKLDLLRVAVVGPALEASGGMGRMMSYTFAVLPPDVVQIRVLDTRGLGSSVWHSLWPFVRSCGTLLQLAFRKRIDVAHVNVAAHGSAVRKGLIVRLCRLIRIPVVLHLHASSFPEFYSPLPSVAQRWVRMTFALATRVVVLSKSWRTYVVDVLEVRPEQVTVLPNATPKLAMATLKRDPNDQLRLLFLGELGPRKGLPELLAAFGDPRLLSRTWQATIAGDGDVQTYRAVAKKLGIDGRVDFVGWIGAEDVAKLLASSHLLLLPSHAEGLPMSVLEAFASGVPVICTPVGGLPEVVIDGQNGLLVASGDVTGLVESILKILDDESLRQRLAVGARNTWQQHHSIEPYARRLTAEWQNAALHKGRTSVELPDYSPAGD